MKKTIVTALVACGLFSASIAEAQTTPVRVKNNGNPAREQRKAERKAEKVTRQSDKNVLGTPNESRKDKTVKIRKNMDKTGNGGQPTKPKQTDH